MTPASSYPIAERSTDERDAHECDDLKDSIVDTHDVVEHRDDDDRYERADKDLEVHGRRSFPEWSSCSAWGREPSSTMLRVITTRRMRTTVGEHGT
jgi:hypothetical protein